MDKFSSAAPVLVGNQTRTYRWCSPPRNGEKLTRERAFAKKLAQEYFERFPKDRYRTGVS
jgi:hypothetical protein